MSSRHDAPWKKDVRNTIFWIGLAVLFNAAIYFWRGGGVALSFTAGYLIEKSLSVDNIFIFLTIFSYFAIPPSAQHKVLNWGILSALVLRGVFIFGGLALIAKFHWVIFLLGGFLVFTGLKMGFENAKPVELKNSPVLRFLGRVIPIKTELSGDRFLVREDGSWKATPLFAALIVIEVTDVLFAVDSIPAVIAVTNDPFIVYTSNIFAILGLRSLYFVLAGAMGKFRHLRRGLAAILIFVGIKMLIKDWYDVPIGASLAVIAALLLISILLD